MRPKPKAVGLLARVRNKAMVVLAAAGLMTGCDKEDEGQKDSTTDDMEMTTGKLPDETGMKTSTGADSEDGSTGDEPAPESTGGEEEVGTTGVDTGDSTTGASTGEVVPDCEEVCMADNMVGCEMEDQQPICSCKEGYTGDCSVCAKGYEKNVLDECEIDKTPPTIRIDTNKGFSPYFIPEKNFIFKGGCEDFDCAEQNVVEVYYRTNGLPADGELDPNFKPGDTTWSREYSGLIKDEVNTYSVKMKDGNGNLSGWKDMVVVRSF